MYKEKCEATDKIGFAVKSIIDYLPVLDMLRYGFWSIKYDSNQEYLLHVGMHSDERQIYVREDVIDKLYENKVIMTFYEYEKQFEQDDFDKEDYTEEELNSYVLNDNYGEIFVVQQGEGESLYITDKSDIEILNNVSSSAESSISFSGDNLSDNSYKIQHKANEFPVPSLSDYIVVVNNQYVYVRLNENEQDYRTIRGSIIKDESVIESINDCGRQVFTKE